MKGPLSALFYQVSADICLAGSILGFIWVSMKFQESPLSLGRVRQWPCKWSSIGDDRNEVLRNRNRNRISWAKFRFLSTGTGFSVFQSGFLSTGTGILKDQSGFLSTGTGIPVLNPIPVMPYHAKHNIWRTMKSKTKLTIVASNHCY